MELRRSVEVFIYREDVAARWHLLMSRRGPTKHGAGSFAVPGGHLDKKSGRWETYEEATIREVKEELGDALADATRRAFEENRVAIVTIADDIRENTHPQIQYVHVALAIRVSRGIEADILAQDSNVEHVGIAWLAKSEVEKLLEQNKLYASQLPQIKNFLDNSHRYTQLEGLQ